MTCFTALVAGKALEKEQQRVAVREALEHDLGWEREEEESVFADAVRRATRRYDR